MAMSVMAPTLEPPLACPSGRAGTPSPPHRKSPVARTRGVPPQPLCSRFMSPRPIARDTSRRTRRTAGVVLTTLTVTATAAVVGSGADGGGAHGPRPHRRRLRHVDARRLLAGGGRGRLRHARSTSSSCRRPTATRPRTARRTSPSRRSAPTSSTPPATPRSRPRTRAAPPRSPCCFDRADALDPANAAALADPATDGIYVLGGDQGLAMQVLADSPAEDAITAAVEGGAALGGTSAGAAVESRTMINGYTGSLGPADGLRQGSTLVWWGDDADLERGLAVGSTGRGLRPALPPARPPRPQPVDDRRGRREVRRGEPGRRRRRLRHRRAQHRRPRPVGRVRRELGRAHRPRDARRDPLLGRQPGHPLGPPGAHPPDDRRHDLRPGDEGVLPRRHRPRGAERRGLDGPGIPLAGRRHALPRRWRPRLRRHRGRRRVGACRGRLEDRAAASWSAAGRTRAARPTLPRRP